MMKSPEVDATCSDVECKQKGDYVLLGSCSNCGLKVNIRFSKGHESKKVDCPNCGCETVRPFFQKEQ